MSDLGNKKVMAKNIQYYLDLNNKDRSDLCNDLGFSYSTVSNWLQGTKYPRIDKIEEMAKYFNITKADLVENHMIFEPVRKKRKNVEDNQSVIIQRETNNTDQLNRLLEYATVLCKNPKLQDLLETATKCNDHELDIAIEMMDQFQKKNNDDSQ